MGAFLCIPFNYIPISDLLSNYLCHWYTYVYLNYLTALNRLKTRL